MYKTTTAGTRDPLFYGPPKDETLVPLDLSDAVALIGRQQGQIVALTAENNELRRRLHTHGDIQTDREKKHKDGPEWWSADRIG